MTTEITTHRTMVPSMGAAEVASDLERLTHLLPSLRDCRQSREEAENMLPALKAPAEPVWMMARVAALLLPYYEKDTPQGVRMIEAEDWAVELAKFPQWAIERSVRWWKSDDNKERRKRPLEGDIAARVKIEMRAVNATAIALRRPASPIPQQATTAAADETRDYKAESDRVMAAWRSDRSE